MYSLRLRAERDIKRDTKMEHNGMYRAILRLLNKMRATRARILAVKKMNFLDYRTLGFSAAFAANLPRAIGFA